uniref:Neprosin PEP catalytic domain-containing protein n=1 Tax=Oryza glumipatula TaxID=40148 RepID=A0A0D9Y3U8_9ORYZ
MHTHLSLKSRSSREEEDNPLQLQPASIQTELISSSSSNSKPTKFREIQERYERDRSTSLTMASSGCSSNRLRQTIVVALLLLASSSCLASAKHRGNGTTTTVPFHGKDELRRYRKIMAQVARLKKASSPDGDVIDCVPAHLQPAFDNPKLRGQKPEAEPEERPKVGGAAAAEAEAEEEAVFPQAWTDGGESCPEKTVPVRRTRRRDVLRSSSAVRFGMKQPRAAGVVRRDSTSDGHEHAVGYVTGDQFYGAKASLNVWSARVATAAEFSLSQIWVISGSFGNDLNTIEAGWQVSPELYGDNNPRFFTYWTTDAYQATGCYNLHCSGFVQTNNRIAIGAAISPTSVYNGRQFDISLLIWKDPRRGHWWLQLGSGPLVGYWPSSLFTHLGGHANMVQFGGEVVNTRPSGSHTPTQMGSGHFPREGFNRAAYFRNLQVVDWDNNLLPAAALRLVADHPSCYDIQGGYNRAWGNYFYYGGPGRNVRCP